MIAVCRVCERDAKVFDGLCALLADTVDGGAAPAAKDNAPHRAEIQKLLPVYYYKLLERRAPQTEPTAHAEAGSP